LFSRNRRPPAFRWWPFTKFAPSERFQTGLQWSAIAAPIIAAPIIAAPIIAVPIIAVPIIAVPIIAASVVATPIIAISTVEREHTGELNMLNRQAGRRRRQEAFHRCGLGEVGAANDRAISGAGRKDNYP
jgi:hypothetical protein